MKKYILSALLFFALGSVSYAGSTNNFSANLASQVTGTLPVANGGTGVVSLGTAGQMLYNSGGVPASSPLLTVGTNALTQGLTYFTGNVGIGTTSPSYTLDVNGTIHATGNVTLAGTGNSVGTITSGTWNGSAVDTAHGGTNASTANGALSNIFGFPLSYATYPEGFITGTTTNASGTDSYISTPILQTIALGANAGKSIALDANSVYIGNHAGQNVVSEGYYQSGGFATIGKGFGNVYIGAAAGGTGSNSACTNGQGGGGFNTFIGFAAGIANTCGLQNTYIGENAGKSATGNTNSANVIIGTDNLGFTGGAGHNTLIGFNTGGYGANLTTGGYNVIIGQKVASTTLATGSYNILIGTSEAVDTPAAATSNYLNIGGAIHGINLGTTGTAVGIGTKAPAATLDVNGTLAVRTGGSTNHAVCWKAGGVLGYCSAVVAANGTCGTCN